MGRQDVRIGPTALQASPAGTVLPVPTAVYTPAVAAGQTAVAIVSTAAATIPPPNVFAGGSGATPGLGKDVPFGVNLSDPAFAGADDDARLTNAMTYVAAQTFHGIPIILDEFRNYILRQQHQVYNGFCLSGAGRPVDQARSSLPIPQRVQLRQTSARGTFTLPAGQVYGVVLQSISFDADANSRVFHPNASSVLWTSTIRDVSYQNGPGVIGSTATKQPVDAFTIEGFGNWNNITDCTMNIGGSDCFIVPSILLVDSPPSQMGPTGNLAYFGSFSKSTICNWYLTAEQHSGIVISGTNDQLTMHNMRIEGRNAGQPCYGALLRISSDLVFYSSWTSYAMSNPSASNGGATNNRGVIHVTAGNVTLRDISYALATGVSQDVPWLYVGGGNVKVRDIEAAGSGWTDKPLVRWLGGTLDADSSVRVVTV